MCIMLILDKLNLFSEENFFKSLIERNYIGMNNRFD